MNLAKWVIAMIVVVAIAVPVISSKSPTLLHPFYKTDTWGLCTVFTFVPYTTNILHAVNFSPIIQNSYYTTPVFASCPTTTIYQAEFETK